MALKRMTFLLCILAFAVSTHAQGQQDPQAISVLTQSLTAMGGLSAVNGIQDYTETGTITYNWANAPVQAPVTVQSMGVTTFRFDSSLSNGTQTWAVDGMTGVLIAPDGTRQPAAFYNLYTAGSLALPALRVAAVLQSPALNITYIGPVTLNGNATYQIHCVLPSDPSNPLPPGLTAYGTFDLFIDATSLLVDSLQETAYSNSNSQVSFAHEIDFSDYQIVSGVSAPFAITESVGGQQTWTIALTSLSFNSGLTESVFTP
jgi:hypothetical protein